MNYANVCPCCTSVMLHHLGNHREYWFCRTCWQEVPSLRFSNQEFRQVNKNRIVDLSFRLTRLPQLMPV